MNFLIQAIFGIFSLLGTLVTLFLLATSELAFKDIKFCVLLGVFVTLTATSFFVLTRNEDNEETNPAKEKIRR